MMKVGVVNFMKSGHPIFLYDALGGNDALGGGNVVVVSHKSDWVSAIKSSRIKHWFLTGSAYDVLRADAPQISLAILEMTNKRFFLICYSMESVLIQLGCHLIKRRTNIREHFSLLMGGRHLSAWRNHYTYVVPDSLKSGMRCLATHDGETMTVEYKNAVMTQWHPEKTEDGVRFLREWLSRKN
jgi:GMP synthase-like glutamine amidotransferase